VELDRWPPAKSPHVKHRPSVAGANTRVEFDEAAITRRSRCRKVAAHGQPRKRALTRGHHASAAVIGRAPIDAAAADLAPRRRRSSSSRDGKGNARGGVCSAGAGRAGGGASASRDAVNRTIQQWEQVPLAPDGPVPSPLPPIAPIPPSTDAPSQPKPLDASR
jgi:hypothetical protein